VIIAGAGIGGLAAGALLARRGKKVLVCSPSSTPEGALGQVTSDGFDFLPGPSLVFGFERDGGYRRLFDELGVQNLPLERTRTYQVALPDKRITMYHEIDRTMAEFKREFPADIIQVEKLFQQLQKTSTQRGKSKISAVLARFRSAGSLLKSYRFSPALILLLDVQSRYFFGKSSAELSVSQLTDLLVERPCFLAHKSKSVSDLLRHKLHDLGGELRFNERLIEIVLQKNKATGLKLAGGSVEGRSIIINTAHHHGPALCLGIRDTVVPVGMENHVLYVPDYSHAQNFISFTVNDTDAAGSSAGMHALIAECFTDNAKQTSHEQRIDQCAELVPFLRDFLVSSADVVPHHPLDMPHDVSFKPIALNKTAEPLLFRGSKHNIFLLHEPKVAPHQLMPSVKKLVSWI